MLWFFLSILAGFVWGVSNTIDKFILSTKGFPPALLLIVASIVGLCFSGIWFVFGDLKPISFGTALLGVAAGLLYGVQFFLAMNAIKGEEVSRVIPLFFLTPAFVLLLSVLFLGEELTAKQIGAVFLIVAGAVAISTKIGVGLSFTRSSYLILAAAFVYALFSIITKYVLIDTDYWTAFAYIRIGVFISAIPLMITYRSRLRETIIQKPKVLTLVAFNETMNLGGMFAFTVALALGSVTLVNALASTSPFFVLMLTALATRFTPQLIEEDISRSTVTLKLAAIACMFTGIFLIT